LIANIDNIGIAALNGLAKVQLSNGLPRLYLQPNWQDDSIAEDRSAGILPALLL
jgi:hypothetical protein